MPLHRVPRFLWLAAATTLAASSAFAAALDVTLSFGSLPSAQGWTYTPAGAHASVVESSVYSVGASTLTMNSMGQSNGISGGSIFYVITNGITTGEAKKILVRARCLQVEGSAGAPAGQGGTFWGFTTGSVQYGFSITPTGAYMLQSTGFVAVGGSLPDNNQYHDYDYEYLSASSQKLYRDAVLLGSTTVGNAVTANRLIFGDGTGGANANMQMTSYEFLQGAATAAHASSWGRIKSLYTR